MNGVEILEDQADHTEAGAADIRRMRQINQDVTRTAFDQLFSLLLKLIGGRGIKVTINMNDRHWNAAIFGGYFKLHGILLWVMRSMRFLYYTIWSDCYFVSRSERPIKY